MLYDIQNDIKKVCLNLLAAIKLITKKVINKIPISGNVELKDEAYQFYTSLEEEIQHSKR